MPLNMNELLPVQSYCLSYNETLSLSYQKLPKVKRMRINIQTRVISLFKKILQ